MTEKLINDIVNILDNVYYWETCPQEYNDKIDTIKKELESKLKKLRVTDVSGALPMSEIVDCGKDGRFKLCNVCGNAKRQ
jgi:hypothetical protein